MVETVDGKYRAKYFQALKEQEQFEKQHGFQLELLRKAVLRMGRALAGLDANLDGSIERLRTAMRGGGGSQVFDQLERVHASVDAFESARTSENAEAAAQMNQLIQQYQTLQIPADLKKSLKDFSKTLNTRLTNYRQYPAALSDLAKLQGLALEAAASPEVGLWQRIRGGRTLSDVNETSVKPVEQTEQEGNLAHDSELELEAELSIDAEYLPAESDFKQSPNNEASVGDSSDYDSADNSRSGSGFVQTNYSHRFDDSEDNYKQVANRISLTLEALVEQIKPNPLIKHKVDIVRHRIRRGMDWFSLAVTLEDIRDILFLRYLQVDEEFSSYLAQVNDELQSIRDALNGAQNREEKERVAADDFSDTVSDRVGRIRKSIADSEEIETLKQEVTEHISSIHDALESFKNERSGESSIDESILSESSLTEQLRQLVDRVHSVESESVKTKEELEQQRHKATHDALTGLPNREAYNERSFHELQRAKRYERPLTVSICDIDFFKKINDNYGHQAGDKVLKLLGGVIAKRLRSVDFVARYGGEEFVILMPETEPEDALKVLEKIRSAVAKSAFRFKEKPVSITLSFGIASVSSQDSVESVFERADKALYKAKESGRNRCIIAD